VFQGKDAGTPHDDIAEQNKLGDDGERGFVTSTGRFIDREEAAKLSGIPTKEEPGKLHTQDVQAAAEPAPSPAPSKTPDVEDQKASAESGEKPEAVKPARKKPFSIRKKGQGAVEPAQATPPPIEERHTRAMQTPAEAGMSQYPQIATHKSMVRDAIARGEPVLATNFEEHGLQMPADYEVGHDGIARQLPSEAVVRETIRLGDPVAAADLARFGFDVPEGYYVGEDGIARRGNEWTEATDGEKGEGEPPPPGRPPSNPLQFSMHLLPIPKYEIRKMTPLDRATTNRSYKLQRSVQDVERAQKEITRLCKTETERNALALYLEANGNMRKLGDWSTLTPPAPVLKGGGKSLERWVKKFNEAAAAAMKLTPDQIALAGKIRDTFDVLHRRGTRHDLIEAFRDNYIPHVWDIDRGYGPMPGGGKLQKRFRFAKARTFDTIADGIRAGMEPKSLDIAKTLGAYMHEMNKVIADKQFVEEISHGLASDGRPLVVPRGTMSITRDPGGDKVYLVMPRGWNKTSFDQKDYQTYPNQPALEGWRWKSADAFGNPIFLNSELALHPEAWTRVHSMIGRSALKDIGLVKAYDWISGSMKREMFSLLAPFHQVQEGTHALAHRVNPFFGLLGIDMRKPEVMDAVKHGLMLRSDKVSGQHYMEGVGAGPTWLTTAMRKVFMGKVADVIDGYQHYLFESYIPRLKYTTYEHINARNQRLMRGPIRRGEMTESDVKLLSALQTNAAFGHQNYPLLDRNPTLQHILQALLLAPDFAEARARFVGQAAKAIGVGHRVGDEQAKAMAFGAMIQAGIALALATLLGGEWDKRRPFEFKKGNRSYTMRSVPEDLFRLASETYGMATGRQKGSEFVSARMNPLLQTLDQLRTGRNYRGEQVTAGQTMEEALGKFIPITARQIPGLRNLNDSTRTNPVTPLQQLAASFGLKVSRVSPITETYMLANEWKHQHAVQSDYSGTYPISKYQQLRYAIEDGDLDRAAQEYKKLSKTMAPTAIAKGFRTSIEHSFTGSKKTDAQFREELNAEGKQVYDAAIDRRHMILESLSEVQDRADKLK